MSRDWFRGFGSAKLLSLLLGALRREAPYKRKQDFEGRVSVVIKCCTSTLIEEGPVRFFRKKIRETKRFLDDEWLTSFLRRCVESTEKVLRAFTITTFLPALSSCFSSLVVIIPEQQYKHSDIEGQKSHDCLLEQALLYSMHLALYPKVEQHCQTNSGMYYTYLRHFRQCTYFNLIWKVSKIYSKHLLKKMHSQ